MRDTWILISLVAAIAFAAGCNRGPQTYPVNGTVIFEDGSPLTTGGVVFTELIAAEGGGMNARGAIDSDGTFQLTTFTDNDGALPGNHRFLVKADRDAEDYTKRGIIPRPVIDERFENYDTSELEFAIEEGTNDIEIVVTKPKKKKSRR